MSAPPYTIRRRAARDLSRQAAWFRREAGVDVANRFLTAAYDTFADLARTPGLGSPVESAHVRLPDMRKWPIPSFPNLRIFYLQRAGGGVRIVRVLHTSQDWAGALGAR